MTILLPALAVAFAALCVWLGVRVYNRRDRWAKWTLAAVVVLPVLYIGSSGPMTMLAFRQHVTHMHTFIPDGEERIQATTHTDRGTWFPVAYAPLVWVSNQPGGDPISRYWSLFPVRFANDDK
jgi:hypothetical protein